MIAGLSPRQQRAVSALAQGRTQEDAAREAGVTPATVRRWQHTSAFIAAVEAETAAIRERLRAEGIANRQNRLDAQNERWAGLKQVIAERAADPALAGVPGGTTGLIVAKPLLVKVYRDEPVELGSPDDEDYERRAAREYFDSARRSVMAYEYAVDTGTLKELRELEKHAAIELGQWAEKHEQKHDLNDFLAALREFGRDGSGKDSA